MCDVRKKVSETIFLFTKKTSQEENQPLNLVSRFLCFLEGIKIRRRERVQKPKRQQLTGEATRAKINFIRFGKLYNRSRLKASADWAGCSKERRLKERSHRNRAFNFGGKRGKKKPAADEAANGNKCRRSILGSEDRAENKTCTSVDASFLISFLSASPAFQSSKRGSENKLRLNRRIKSSLMIIAR